MPIPPPDAKSTLKLYGIAGAITALVIAGIVFLGLHKSHKTPKVATHTPPAMTVAGQSLAYGLSLANDINKIPPTTNKLIAIEGCVYQGGSYTCAYVGNNAGSLYCARISFDVIGSQFAHIKQVTLPNSACNL